MDKSLDEHEKNDSDKMEASFQELVENKKIQEISTNDATKNMNIKDGNPYGYLERGDFSSEKFKLELSNLPPRFGLVVGVYLIDLFYI